MAILSALIIGPRRGGFARRPHGRIGAVSHSFCARAAFGHPLFFGGGGNPKDNPLHIVISRATWTRVNALAANKEQWFLERGFLAVELGVHQTFELICGFGRNLQTEISGPQGSPMLGRANAGRLAWHWSRIHHFLNFFGSTHWYWYWYWQRSTCIQFLFVKHTPTYTAANFSQGHRWRPLYCGR